MPDEISLKEYMQKLEDRITELEKMVIDLRVKIAWFSGLGTAIGAFAGQLINHLIK